MGKRKWALLLVIGACTPIEPGNLGNGKFGYACVGQFPNDASNFDATCAPGVLATNNTVPSQVAVGSTFTVTYKSNAQLGEESVISAGPSLLALTGGHFQALRAGNVAIIGTHAGQADDLLYVKIAKLASLKLTQTGGGQLEAMPLAADNTVLGGNLACTWEWSTTNTAVQIQSVGRKAHVYGLPGTSATVFAKCGDVSNQIVITVTTSNGDGGTDASSDAPTDSSSDAATDGGTNG
jgi:hypothetical protein